MTTKLTQEEYQRIKDIKRLDLQLCSYCHRLNILNLGWKPFGKYYCRKHERDYFLCWELCYKVCVNILKCELVRERSKREEKVAVNQEYYRASCYGCGKKLEGAGKHGVVKNRNNPQFWGIKSVYKILCLGCMEKRHYFRMSTSKKKTFRKYLKRRYE